MWWVIQCGRVSLSWVAAGLSRRELWDDYSFVAFNMKPRSRYTIVADTAAIVRHAAIESTGRRGGLMVRLGSAEGIPG